MFRFEFGFKGLILYFDIVCELGICFSFTLGFDMIFDNYSSFEFYFFLFDNWRFTKILNFGIVLISHYMIWIWFIFSCRLDISLNFGFVLHTLGFQLFLFTRGWYDGKYSSQHGVNAILNTLKDLNAHYKEVVHRICLQNYPSQVQDKIDYFICLY